MRLGEQLGLGPLTPEATSAVEAAAELFKDGLLFEADPAMLAHAHAAVIGSAPVQSWFEAGEAVEGLLAPARMKKQRVDALMKTYLPGRRAYWAKTCALSALAPRGPAKKKPGPFAYELALIARDIASRTPIEKLPLMRAIAETTAEAFVHNARR